MVLRFNISLWFFPCSLILLFEESKDHIRLVQQWLRLSHPIIIASSIILLKQQGFSFAEISLLHKKLLGISHFLMEKNLNIYLPADFQQMPLFRDHLREKAALCPQHKVHFFGIYFPLSIDSLSVFHFPSPKNIAAKRH